MKACVNINIRVATVDDLDVLLQLEVACEETPHWNEDIWRSMLKANAGPRWHRVLIAEQDEVATGFVVLAGLGGVSELESIAVVPALRSKGFGRALCFAAIQCAVDLDSRTMDLEVRAASDVPRRLYASVGFLEQGIRRGYYRDPVDDAVLMSVALPAPETKR